jgi:FkbM family methyltransferase
MPFNWGNTVRTVFAILIIKSVRAPWRIGERMLGRQFPVKDHYLIMRIFRSFTSKYPVKTTYPNPVSKNVQTITLSLDLCKNSQQWYFRMKGWYEREWIKLISAAMEHSETFVDVGAHLGVFTITIAQAYPDRRAIAIEPTAANFEKLGENIALNHLCNVRMINAAVTESDQPVQIYLNPINDGGASLIEPTEYRTGDVRIAAPKYRARHTGFVAAEEADPLRLDDIITGPSVLKIDVEGAEVTVLRSGRTALESGWVDVMVLEITKDTLDEVIKFLDTVNFDCFMYGQQKPILNAGEFNWRLGNVLCLRRRSGQYRSQTGLEATDGK